MIKSNKKIQNYIVDIMILKIHFFVLIARKNIRIRRRVTLYSIA